YNDTIYQITCKMVNAGTEVFTYPGSNGCDSTITVITTYEPLTAKFYHSSSGLTTQFTNTSTGATQYLWFFGDGQSSTEVNPTHTYNRSGLYLVALWTYNPECGIRLKLKIIFVFGGFREQLIINDNHTNYLNDINIYPNPSSGIINIRFNSPAIPPSLRVDFDDDKDIKVTVINLHGAIVHSQNIKPYDQNIDLHDLSNGTYILKFTSESESKDIKIILMK
ncbi:MAG: T9SS type A sorting domain-containing protein, partial [Chitinophagales bacterium]